MPDPLGGPEHDDVLGRAFDRRLAGRLWSTVRPHHRLVWSSIALFPVVALVELAQPYLLKVAIDDYILQSDWRGLAGIAGLSAATLVGLYGLRMLEASGSSTTCARRCSVTCCGSRPGSSTAHRSAA